MGLFGRVRWRRISVAQIPGGLVIGDPQDYGSEERPPTQGDLDAVIAAATQVTIREPVESKTPAFETSEASELASLRHALRIRDGGIGHCMCFGDVALDFRRGAEAAGTVTVHHGESLRWPPFFDNAALAEPDELVDWLAARGMPRLREQVEQNRRERLERGWLLSRWREAMPAALEPLWPLMRDPSRSAWPEVLDALDAEYPDPVSRARVLMEWLGHGAGPWSGFPSYEQAPEWCLLQLLLEDLVEAAKREPRSEQLLEGAARLFAGWQFRCERELELARIPDDLKGVLLSHALESDDEDKRARAAAAFVERGAT
jgi:hypothetical protein